MRRPAIAVAVDLVVFTIRPGGLHALLVRRGRDPFAGQWALPGGFVEAEESLEAAARRELFEETGLSGVHMEQIYTFGEPARDPRGRVISVAYLALLPAALAVPRAGSDAAAAAFHPARRPPRLAFDHDLILRTAVERLRTKAEYSTLPLRFLGGTFTLTELQSVYEAILDRPLDKRNFRKKILALDAIEETGAQRRSGTRRPARLFRLAPKSPYLLKERGILFPF